MAPASSAALNTGLSTSKHLFQVQEELRAPNSDERQQQILNAPLDRFPPYDAVMETLADMMDRALLPENGGNSEAGKAIFRQITSAARARVEQVKQTKDTQQTTRREAYNDNR